VSYSVVVSEQVKALLQALHRDDRRRLRELALLLLRLEKDARPKESRKLAGGRTGTQSASEERVWEIAGFRIAYRVSEAKRTVEVGLAAKVR
jgi:mRNA-degrading endonuclease RelE of RelBE toxin-antitoxin system